VNERETISGVWWRLIEEEHPRAARPKRFRKPAGDSPRAAGEPAPDAPWRHAGAGRYSRPELRKGGASVLADGVLARAALSDAEAGFVYNWGVFLAIGRRSPGRPGKTAATRPHAVFPMPPGGSLWMTRRTARSISRAASCTRWRQLPHLRRRGPRRPVCGFEGADPRSATSVLNPLRGRGRRPLLPRLSFRARDPLALPLRLPDRPPPADGAPQRPDGAACLKPSSPARTTSPCSPAAQLPCCRAEPGRCRRGHE